MCFVIRQGNNILKYYNLYALAVLHLEWKYWMVAVCTVYKDNNAYNTCTPTILLLVKLNIYIVRTC